MNIDPVRRQVLRAAGGLVLAPVSVGLPADGHGAAVMSSTQFNLICWLHWKKVPCFRSTGLTCVMC